MKTISTKVDRKDFDDFIESCNQDGCTISEKLRALVLDSLGDDTPQIAKEEPQKITVEVSPEEEEGLKNGTWEIKQKPVELENIRVSHDDGKTWHDTNTIS